MLVFLAFGILFAGSLVITLIPQAEELPQKKENPGYDNQADQGQAPQNLPAGKLPPFKIPPRGNPYP